MKFPRQIVMNTEEECRWLRVNHQLPTNEGYPPFQSFTLHGTNENPSQFDLYTDQKPAYNVYPFAIVTKNDDGEWVVSDFAQPEARVRGRPTMPTTKDSNDRTSRNDEQPAGADPDQ